VAAVKAAVATVAVADKVEVQRDNNLKLVGMMPPQYIEDILIKINFCQTEKYFIDFKQESVYLQPLERPRYEYRILNDKFSDLNVA
jgi:hypothetical protein